MVKDNSFFDLDIKAAVCISVSLSWSLLTALSVQLCKKAESSGEFDLCLRCACTEQQHEPVDSQSAVLLAGGMAGRNCMDLCTVSTKPLRRAARLTSSSAPCYSHGLCKGSGAVAPEVTLPCPTSKAGVLSWGGSRLGQHTPRDTCQRTQMGRAELPHAAAAWGCCHWHPSEWKGGFLWLSKRGSWNLVQRYRMSPVGQGMPPCLWPLMGVGDGVIPAWYPALPFSAGDLNKHGWLTLCTIIDLVVSLPRIYHAIWLCKCKWKGNCSVVVAIGIIKTANIRLINSSPSNCSPLLRSFLEGVNATESALG